MSTHLEVAADPTATLQTFTLDDLAPYTREGSFAPGDSPDYREFDVGRDDVHGVLKHLLSRVSRSVRLSMFGYDDVELDQIIQGLIEDEHVFFQGTLDASQASTPTERKIIAGWDSAVRSVFAIGRTATGQIEHTKGGVLDGVVAFEGSTNWSGGGEGIGIGLHGQANAVGYKAQANTLIVHVNPVRVQRFTDYLDEQHASIHLAKAKAA